MSVDICTFCKSCTTCAKAKTLTSKPQGKLHSLDIPTKPWDSIGMDFLSPFLETKGHNYPWVIFCRITGMVHLILVHTKMKASELS